ncbi:hypothetical protein KFL_007780080 [Klebsormidium nitens]|uniref:Uncharacterized protein n=1 Tax=Klebsormidium nitens TaxID=105231 RepID=A0A1Y1IKK9_KLENI|nr:hypothetical protein KFL_007780080 [Klebsormidium nitens]|eukprot:GAQ91400.1 hypothetical protein KFL_007780080 [Klebsormidium nitens]
MDSRPIRYSRGISTIVTSYTALAEELARRFLLEREKKELLQQLRGVEKERDAALEENEQLRAELRRASELNSETERLIRELGTLKRCASEAEARKHLAVGHHQIAKEHYKWLMQQHQQEVADLKRQLNKARDWLKLGV